MSKELLVKQFMNKNLITFNENLDIREVVEQLITKNISGAPVVNNSKDLVGVISTKDCINAALKAQYYDSKCGPVKDYMSKIIKSVSEDLTVFEVATEFSHSNYHRFLVTDANENLVGIITRKDILKALSKVCDAMRL